jgi:plastocyanin
MALVPLVLAGLLAGCGAAATTPTPSGPATAATTVLIPAADGYGASSFAPGTMNITAGTTVAWKNNDSIVHAPVSDTGVFQASIGPGGDFSRTFATKGSFPYHCSLHPGMVGTINVQ